jgi:hypothetical protein
MTFEEKKKWLEARGMTVGARDPNQNRAFEGDFMVAEPVLDGDPYPTDDARDGRFCIVGKELTPLVNEAYEWWLDN